MMRPVSLALPPSKADVAVDRRRPLTGKGNNRRRHADLERQLDHRDLVPRAADDRRDDLDRRRAPCPSPLGDANTHGTRTLTDPTSNRDHGLPVPGGRRRTPSATARGSRA